MLVSAMGYFQPGVGIVVENADSFMCYTWPVSLHCMLFWIYNCSGLLGFLLTLEKIYTEPQGEKIADFT